MNFHFYADDCQLYFSFNSVSSATITRIEACLQYIATWMSLNKLTKLNGDKTELLVIGSRNLSASQLPSFTAIDGSVIQPSHSARKFLQFVNLHFFTSFQLTVLRRWNKHIRQL